MSIEYIKDKDGNLGVFIPMEIWEEMDVEISASDEIPQWQKDELDRRGKNYNEEDSISLEEFRKLRDERFNVHA
jgi:hypothetical protein